LRSLEPCELDERIDEGELEITELETRDELTKEDDERDDDSIEELDEKIVEELLFPTTIDCVIELLSEVGPRTVSLTSYAPAAA